MKDTPAVSRMTTELERLLADVNQDIRDGRNLSPAFRTSEEMDTYLDSN